MWRWIFSRALILPPGNNSQENRCPGWSCSARDGDQGDTEGACIHTRVCLIVQKHEKATVLARCLCSQEIYKPRDMLLLGQELKNYLCTDGLSLPGLLEQTTSDSVAQNSRYLFSRPEGGPEEASSLASPPASGACWPTSVYSLACGHITLLSASSPPSLPARSLCQISLSFLS